MKILVSVNELNVRGGTHKQVLRLCEYLCKEHEVTIYTTVYDKEKTYPGFAQFKIITYALEEKKKIKLLKKVRNKLHKIKFYRKLVKDFDIINIHDDIGMMAFIAKKEKKKVVFQINDMPKFFLQGVATGQKDTIKNKLKRFKFRQTMQYVDEITVNVSKNREVVKKCLNREAHVFYCGVDVNKQLARHVKMHDNQTIHLFSSGVFFPYRNYETLVKIVNKLVKNGISVHLDIMGSIDLDKEYATSIKKMVNNMGLESYITIWGQVDEEKYIELHDNADMFLFININQSWGLAVFEAMSCGLPVIISESVGAIELLKDQENALIVDPENVEEIYNEIIELKEDAAHYASISNHAYEIVKEFTWDNLYSSKMLALFEKIEKEK